MAYIKFERTSAPTGSVQFTVNPNEADYNRKIKYMQPKDYADGGDLYCYDKGITAKNYRSLKWAAMPAADLTSFLAFLAVVVGSKYNFTFTDHDGVTYTARIINADEMPSAPTAGGNESLPAVELLIEA